MILQMTNCCAYYARESIDPKDITPGYNSRLLLPITIIVCKAVKIQLQNNSSYTLVEKRLLRPAFTLAFYAFLRASEFTASSLLWSNVQSSTTTIAILQLGNNRETMVIVPFWSHDHGTVKIF